MQKESQIPLNFSSSEELNKFNFCEINFEEIKEIWSCFLWPERTSQIEEISYINHFGKIDNSIENWARPNFYAIKIENDIVCVTSVFQTAKNVWRLRGTWVKEDFRRFGVGKKIIELAIRKIEAKNFLLWTMARNTSSGFYFKNDFRPFLEVSGYEYGPHIIVTKAIGIITSHSEQNFQSESIIKK